MACIAALTNKEVERTRKIPMWLQFYDEVRLNDGDAKITEHKIKTIVPNN